MTGHEAEEKIAAMAVKQMMDGKYPCLAFVSDVTFEKLHKLQLDRAEAAACSCCHCRNERGKRPKDTFRTTILQIESAAGRIEVRAVGNDVCYLVEKT